MKKRMMVVACLVAAVLLCSACRASLPAQGLDPVPTPTVDPIAQEIDNFFKQYVNTSERPVAVMIDNDDKNARPQIGLNDAYLIYELAVEGGATRFMALFRNADTQKIGPVRSSRHYFLDYLMENDGIYTHYGWSPKAIQDISAFGINKINGVLGGDGNIFWREEKFKGDWHSAYTSIKNIKEMAVQKGFAMETSHKNGILYADRYINLPAENVANTISLPYSSFYRTGYAYNATTGLYEKSINGQPHVMQDGAVVSVKNVIALLIHDTSLGDGTDRRDINTTGSGKGYYFTGGAYEEITWSKASRSGNTVFKKADGTELLINPGNTIVNVISPSATITIE